MESVRICPTAFRFDPTVKEAFAVIANKDGRSMANMLEWLIKRQCEREGLGWPPAGAKSAADTQTKTAKAAEKAPRATKK